MFQHKIWEEGYQAVEFSSLDLWVLITVYQNSLEDPGCVLVSVTSAFCFLRGKQGKEDITHPAS